MSFIQLTSSVHNDELIMINTSAIESIKTDEKGSRIDTVSGKTVLVRESYIAIGIMIRRS